MGGGKKKQSLKQLTKTKAPKQLKQKKRKLSALTSVKKGPGLIIPDINDKKILTELKGMKVLTPFSVASHFNIRLSLAKTFLRQLEKRKMIEYVSGGKNLKIYKPIT